MKATVSLTRISDFVKATSAMRHHGRVPILGGVHITASASDVTLYRTDYEVFVRQTLPGGESDGSVVVSAASLADALKSLAPTGKAMKTATVTLAESGSVVEVSVNHGPIVRLDTMPTEDFPTFAHASDFRSFAWLSADDLAAIVRSVVPATSDDDTIPMLQSVALEIDSAQTLWAMATNRYVAAFLPVGTPLAGNNTRVMVPGKALKLVAKLASGRVDVESVAGFYLRFRTDDMEAIVKPYDDFPKLRALLPTSGLSTGTVSRKPLLDAVKRIKQLGGKNQPAQFAMRGDEMTVAVADSEGKYSTAFPLAVHVASLSDTYADPRYVALALSAFTSDVLRWQQVSPMKPQLFTSDTEPLTWLVMPMRAGS